MNANANNSSNNVDELDFGLLDKNLEDIEDLPGFEVPSPGRYVLALKVAMKRVNNKAAAEFSYEVVECLAKNKSEDPDAVPKTKFSNLYFLQGSDEAVTISMGKMKELVKAVAEATGINNLGVLCRDTLRDAIVEADVSARQDREDKEKFYPVIKNMKLA